MHGHGGKPTGNRRQRLPDDDILSAVRNPGARWSHFASYSQGPGVHRPAQIPDDEVPEHARAARGLEHASEEGQWGVPEGQSNSLDEIHELLPEQRDHQARRNVWEICGHRESERILKDVLEVHRQAVRSQASVFGHCSRKRAQWHDDTVSGSLEGAESSRSLEVVVEQLTHLLQCPREADDQFQAPLSGSQTSHKYVLND